MKLKEQLEQKLENNQEKTSKEQEEAVTYVAEKLKEHKKETIDAVKYLSDEIIEAEERITENEREITTAINYVEQESNRNATEINKNTERIKHLEKAVQERLDVIDQLESSQKDKEEDQTQQFKDSALEKIKNQIQEKTEELNEEKDAEEQQLSELREIIKNEEEPPAKKFQELLVTHLVRKDEPQTTRDILQKTGLGDKNWETSEYQRVYKVLKKMAEDGQIHSKLAYQGGKQQRLFSPYPIEDEEETEAVEPEEIDTDDQEKQIDSVLKPGHYTVGERKNKIEKILREADGSLTRNQIAKRLYGKKPSGSSSPYYTRISSALKKIRATGKLETSTLTTGRNVYTLKEEGEETQEETQSVDTTETSTEIQNQKWKNGEELEADYWTTEERVELIKQALTESDEPLTREELAHYIYNTDEPIIYGNKYSNRMTAPIRRLKQKGVIEKKGSKQVQRYGEDELIPHNAQRYTSLKSYGFTDEYADSSQKQEQRQEDEYEQLTDYELAKRQAGVTDREMKSVINTFQKCVEKTEEYSKDQRRISYHLFEQYWGGDMSSMKMFQKLFSNTTLLTAVQKEVAPETVFKWQKKDSGKYDSGVRNWVIKLE